SRPRPRAVFTARDVRSDLTARIGLRDSRPIVSGRGPLEHSMPARSSTRSTTAHSPSRGDRASHESQKGTTLLPPHEPADLGDPVPHRMREDFTPLFVDQTVSEALDWLRRHPPPGRVIYFYVVDQDRRLRGVVPTRRLVLSPPDTRIAD